MPIADSASTSTSALPVLPPPFQPATIKAVTAIAPIAPPKYLLPKNHPAHPRKSIALPPPILAKIQESSKQSQSHSISQAPSLITTSEKPKSNLERHQVLAPPPFSPILPPMLPSPCSNPDDMFRRRSRDSFPPRLDDLFLPHSDEILRMTSTPRVEGAGRMRNFRMGRSAEVEMEIIEEISSEAHSREDSLQLSEDIKKEDVFEEKLETAPHPRAQTLPAGASIRSTNVAQSSKPLSANSIDTAHTTTAPILSKSSRRASRVPTSSVPPPLLRAFLKKSQPSLLTTSDRPNPTSITATTTSLAPLPVLSKSSRRASRVPNPHASPPRARAFLKKSQPAALVTTLPAKPYSRPLLTASRVFVENVDAVKTTIRLTASGAKLRPAGRLSISGPARVTLDIPVPPKVTSIRESTTRPAVVISDNHTISDQPKLKVKAKSSAISLTLPTDFGFTSSEREEERRAKIRARMEEREIREEERKAREAKESKKRASAWAVAADPVAKVRIPQ